MAKCIPQAMTFFGVIQRLYTIFSASTERWEILNKHLHGLTLKPICETRWECRLESVKAVKEQLQEIKEALLEVSNTTKIPAIQSEAKSILEYEMTFEFILSTVIWYDLLNAINKVSKILQREDISIDFALKNYVALKVFLTEYRENGYKNAEKETIKLCQKLEIIPEFKKKRNIKRKKMFDYESPSMSTSVSDNNVNYFKNEYFFPILDQGIVSINERFQQLDKFNDYFGFLYNIGSISKMDKDDLMKNCMDVQILLEVGDTKDVDGRELFDELVILCEIIEEDTSPLKVLEKIFSYSADDIYCNVSIVLRILLTMPVTTASAERSFSKLKLIKNYLRSTLSQEKITNLAIISIEKKIADQLKYDEIIDQFADLKSRKVNF